LPDTVISKRLYPWVNLIVDQHEVTPVIAALAPPVGWKLIAATPIEGVIAGPLVSSDVGRSLISSVRAMLY